MSYYPTLDEDLKRAREILERGKAERSDPLIHDYVDLGGTIYGADTYAAYKLLESFVAAIDTLREEVKAARVSEDAAGAGWREALELNRALSANLTTREEQILSLCSIVGVDAEEHLEAEVKKRCR